MPSPSKTWYDTIYEQICLFVRKQALTPCQRGIFEIALAALQRSFAEEKPLLFIDIPASVHIAAGGNEHKASQIGVVCALAFLGADILDDLADGDVRPEWQDSSPAELTLAAATCLSALAPLALSEINFTAETSVSLHNTLANGLLRMAAGQHQDLHFTAADQAATPKCVEEAVAGKSGEEFAMFCSLAAQAAEADVETTRCYAAMGQAIGTGGQLASDCFELLEDPDARDLRQGTLTVPVALHLASLVDAEKQDFQEQLTMARFNETAREAVRRAVKSSGALRVTAFIIETYRQRALRELENAKPTPEGKASIIKLLEGISLFNGRTVD